MFHFTIHFTLTKFWFFFLAALSNGSRCKSRTLKQKFKKNFMNTWLSMPINTWNDNEKKKLERQFKVIRNAKLQNLIVILQKDFWNCLKKRQPFQWKHRGFWLVNILENIGFNLILQKERLIQIFSNFMGLSKDPSLLLTKPHQ